MLAFFTGIAVAFLAAALAMWPAETLKDIGAVVTVVFFMWAFSWLWNRIIPPPTPETREKGWDA